MNRQFESGLRERAAAQGLTFDDRQAGLLWEYYALLQTWNRRTNLTALPLDDFPATSIDRLLIEPAIASTLLQSESAILDLGSGGGSPAIPLHILLPGSGLTMVESRERKAAFLREAARRLQLSQTRVFSERFEKVTGIEAGSADVISIRAVKLEPALLEQIRSWLAPHGSVLLFGSPTLSPDSGLEEVTIRELPGSTQPLRVLRKR